MNHLEFAASESAALEPTGFEKWAARLERMLGHDLDGDETADGYSLDGCLDMYRAGNRPLDAFHTIAWRKLGLHKPACPEQSG